MQVGIVTPYYRETLDVLQKCHESVRSQTHACTHFMVADGFPRAEISGWEVQHIVLARSHADVGNTPRAIGSLSAMNQGFDAIAYLDADNWYYPHHVEAMIQLHQQTGAAVCTTRRTIHRQDESLMFVDRECDGVIHVDSSCYFLTREAFRILPIWAMMPQQLGPIADHVMLDIIRSLGLRCAHNSDPTVAFRTQYAAHYEFAGETPPAGMKTIAESIGKAMQWWANLPDALRADWQRRMGLRP